MKPLRAGTLGGLALIAALLASGAGHAPSAALADGDPASDILLFSDVSLPYSAPVSEVEKNRLLKVAVKAKRAGYPVKVAIISSSLDLGTDDRFTGHPAGYARFLSEELTSPKSYSKHKRRAVRAANIKVPILIVMDDGIALAQRGKSLSAAAVGNPKVPNRPGADPLAEQAVIAIKRLATQAGHPLRGIGPSPPATGSGQPVSTQNVPGGSASSSSDDSSLSGWAIAGIVAIALVALAAIGVVVTRLSRRRSANGS
jgi:hypothetical protein